MKEKASVRWTAAVLAGVTLLVFALNGTASAPPAAQSVRIVDREDPDIAARVVPEGNLQVGGTVAIDSSTPIATTSIDDPARMAFGRELHGSWADGNIYAAASFDVPQGKRLVITHVSGTVSLPPSQQLIDVILAVQIPTAGVHVDHYFVPTFTGGGLARDHYSFSQDALIHAESQVSARLVREGDFPTGEFIMSISGYLIDCEVAPCN